MAPLPDGWGLRQKYRVVFKQQKVESSSQRPWEPGNPVAGVKCQQASTGGAWTGLRVIGELWRGSLEGEPRCLRNCSQEGA